MDSDEATLESTRKAAASKGESKDVSEEAEIELVSKESRSDVLDSSNDADDAFLEKLVFSLFVVGVCREASKNVRVMHRHQTVTHPG
jgi:hypothetical protein